MRRNQSLYCHYHQDHGHTTEDCRNLWDHLDQLVQEGKLKQLLHHSSGRGNQTSSAFLGDVSSRPHLGMINVIFATLGRTGSCPFKVISVSCCPDAHFFNLIWSLKVWLVGLSAPEVVVPSLSFKAPSVGITVKAKSC